MKTLTTAIIGAGFIADRHVGGLVQIPDIKVTAVVDVNSEKAKKIALNFGAKVYKSIEELYQNETVDFLDICLPTTLHKDAAVFGMKKGSHVLVEKPFATTLEDCEAMIKCAAETGKKLMVAQVCRFRPEYIYLKKLVESGELGKPVFYTAGRISSAPTWSWNNWLQSKELSGGTVMDLSIHDIDMSNWLFGRPLSCFSKENMIKGKEGPSHVMSLLTYENGMTSCLEATHLMPEPYKFSSFFRIVLEKGAIEFNFIEGEPLKLIKIDEKEEKPVKEILEKMTANSYGAEISHFADNIRNGGELKVTPDSAKLSVETILNLIQSSETGQVINM